MSKEDTNENSISPMLTNITQEQISILDQENTDGEGWDYYCNGQVIYAIVSKNEISGIIREYLHDYKVQVKVDEHEISCTCSCDSENVICNHVVALLYSWVYDQSEFTNLDHFMIQIENMDKELLINAVEQFIADNPRNIKFFQNQKNLEFHNIDLDISSYD